MYLREEFEEQEQREVVILYEGADFYDEEYVEWLEARIEKMRNCDNCIAYTKPEFDEMGLNKKCINCTKLSKWELKED